MVQSSRRYSKKVIYVIEVNILDSNYVKTPVFTTFQNISEKNYVLSASRYKSLQIENQNIHPLVSFLDRNLIRSDLGRDIGSEYYIDNSPYQFIKTKALQKESYLLNITKESVQNIIPQGFTNMQLKKEDILISKDGNVGEVVILDKDYPHSMLCGGIYKLPISNYKYYLLAFIKSEFFRQQIDFLVSNGSTIRHGKTKFLDCMIPLPNKNSKDTIRYIELLMQAIVDKERLIKEKHKLILKTIQKELEQNQKDHTFSYTYPNISEIMQLDRMDSSLYSESFKKEVWLIRNYEYGTSTIKEMGFTLSRGQNLQISNIGKSIQTEKYVSGYYKLILPKFLTTYGTIKKVQYLGNSNSLKTLNKGDIIFGAEGNEKGRSIVIVDDNGMAITNIHGITINQGNHNLQKSIFVKLFLDYYRSKGMIDDYAVGGNGGSLAIKYWNLLKFPKFPFEKESEITKMYHNQDILYDTSNCDIATFHDYDNYFNENAGILELDSSMRYLKKKLNKAIDNIINNEDVIIEF